MPVPPEILLLLLLLLLLVCNLAFDGEAPTCLPTLAVNAEPVL